MTAGDRPPAPALTVNDVYEAGRSDGESTGFEAGYTAGFESGREIGAAVVLAELQAALGPARLSTLIPVLPFVGEYARLQAARALDDGPCDHPAAGGRCSRCGRWAWVQRRRSAGLPDDFGGIERERELGAWPLPWGGPEAAVAASGVPSHRLATPGGSGAGSGPAWPGSVERRTA